MPGKMLLCLAVLSATGAAAATSGFLLGMDYSEWLDPNHLPSQIASDSSGALYILASCVDALGSPSCVTKLSADGKTVPWQNALGFTAAAMAVDPNGGVYVASAGAYEGTFDLVVEKLSADGAGVAWRTQTGIAGSSMNSLAVDSTGRAFVAAYGTNGASVVRLSATGTVDYTLPLSVPDPPTAIAVDPTGTHIVVALAASGGWVLARLTPDGAAWSYSTSQFTQTPALAVAPNGDAIVYGSDAGGNWSLRRMDPTGALVFANAIVGTKAQCCGYGPTPGLTVDGAGNAYITGYIGSLMHFVRNTLAPCGSAWLSVYAPDGSLLQTTYIPGSSVGGVFIAQIATSPSSAVFVVDSPEATFAPTQTGPFPANPQYGEVLMRLSPNANAQTLPLACVGNAASYNTGAISPGELVTLIGNGLGPQQGVQTVATPQTPFPTKEANVEVTFDGTPAPLLWVQDQQINLAVPWSVNGQSTQICVSYNSVKTNCLIWPVVQAAPGVFTVDGVYAAAVNQDGTVNSAANPAAAGSVVSIFATGLGPINPPQGDGSLVGLPLPVNVLPTFVGQPCTTAWFCGAPAQYQVVYFGPAPLEIAGLSQVNFQVTSYPNSINAWVETPTGMAFSNAFQVYVAGQ